MNFGVHLLSNSYVGNYICKIMLMFPAIKCDVKNCYNKVYVSIQSQCWCCWRGHKKVAKVGGIFYVALWKVKNGWRIVLYSYTSHLKCTFTFTERSVKWILTGSPPRPPPPVPLTCSVAISRSFWAQYGRTRGPGLSSQLTGRAMRLMIGLRCPCDGADEL